MLRSCDEYVCEIHAIANHLNELVHDLLDVGQALSGNFAVDLSKEIDICDVVKRSIRINHDISH